MKTKVKTCQCEAYDFPHRLDSGKCRTLYNSDISKDFKAGMARDFERSEAQAMNSERSIFNNVRF